MDIHVLRCAFVVLLPFLVTEAGCAMPRVPTGGDKEALRCLRKEIELREFLLWSHLVKVEATKKKISGLRELLKAPEAIERASLPRGSGYVRLLKELQPLVLERRERLMAELYRLRAEVNSSTKGS